MIIHCSAIVLAMSLGERMNPGWELAGPLSRGGREGKLAAAALRDPVAKLSGIDIIESLRAEDVIKLGLQLLGRQWLIPSGTPVVDQ